ncbi:DNA-invertase [Salmonella sp. NCTC 11881]|nr:DNA-invertase [Salmonella sp. NCTC 11881]
MATIGYIRVSTIDQNIDLQRNALTSANCDRIFEDRISGKIGKPPPA